MAPEEYRVTAPHLELPRDTTFCVDDFPVHTGSLCLFQIGETYLTIGRWVPGWIVQPGRWIRLASNSAVKIIGTIVPIALWTF